MSKDKDIPWYKNPKNIFIPLDKLQEPPTTNGYFQTLVNRWWLITEKGEAILYMGCYPQCNPSKTMAEKWSEHVPGSKAVLVNIAYIPHHCES